MSAPDEVAGAHAVPFQVNTCPVVALDCASVDTVCVPVWLARFSRVASELLTVAPVATPFNLVLSAPLMNPATEVVALECAAPPTPKCAVI